jgi:hypothetical protein
VATGFSDGILVQTGASATIQDSVILGGLSTPQSHGVDVPGGGTVTLSADRIYGGAGGTHTTGVYVSSANTFTLANSEVHAGTTAGGASVGVDLSGTIAPTIVDSTIYVSSGIAISITAEAVDAGTNAVIENDLLVGGEKTSATGVVLTSSAGAANCDGIVTKLDHTAFANLPTFSGCTTSGVTSTLAQLAGACGGWGTNCTGDVAIGCTGTGCIAAAGCPGTAAQCLPSVFGSWSNDGRGIFIPLAGGGFGEWVLAPTYPAFDPIACGGTPLASVTTDMLGAPRSATVPTIGAVNATLPDGGSPCP